MSVTQLWIMYFVFILWFIGCIAGIPGGWSDVDDVKDVQKEVDELNNEIITLMRNAGYDLNNECAANVISAQKQVVNGLNYKCSIEICGYYADIRFYVPPLQNGKQGRARGLTLISSRGKDAVDRKKKSEL